MHEYRMEKLSTVNYHNAVDDSAVDVTTGREETVVIGIGVNA